LNDLTTKLKSTIALAEKPDKVQTVVIYDAKNDVKDYASVLDIGDNSKIGMTLAPQPNFPFVAIVIGGIQFLIFAMAMGGKPKA
jgi:hypothetical protein